MKCKIDNIEFPIIMCIITFLIGLFFLFLAFDVTLKAGIIIALVGFLPFIYFLYITKYYYQLNKKIEIEYKCNYLILTAILLMYYFMGFCFCGIIELVIR